MTPEEVTRLVGVSKDRLSPVDLEERGRCLFGEQWQCALARALRVNDRTVRRWKAGKSKIPKCVSVAIDALILRQIIAVGGLIRLIDRKAS
jgi:hypothetical protein